MDAHVEVAVASKDRFDKHYLVLVVVVALEDVAEPGDVAYTCMYDFPENARDQKRAYKKI